MPRGLLRAIVAAALSVGAAVAAAPAGATTARVPLELFVHPGSGGAWASHPVLGVATGASRPAMAAIGGDLVLAEEAVGGDVVVADGSLFGAFTPVDLTQALGAPAAAGPPALLAVAGGLWLWYRTSTGDLEVASRARRSTTWTLTDVTVATTSPSLAGDPFALATAAGPVAFAVVSGGTVEEFAPPTSSGASWTASSLTSACPVLAGGLVAMPAPDAPLATVVLATASGGDLVELSDDVATPPGSVGAWGCQDLSAVGYPGASTPLSAISGEPYAAYASWGTVEGVTIESGLPGGVHVEDLSQTDDLWPASTVPPTVVAAPGGPEVAQVSTEHNLLLAQFATTPRIADVSFQLRTARLVRSSVASTFVGSAAVLVASDAGPIASSPLRTRIAVLAASFDQQHAGYQTDPSGSDCNRFTAWFGRGSTSGCPRGTSAEAWCSDFAEYVWQTAGVPVAGITGWSATFVQWGAAHHRVQWGTHFTAAVGDAIVWGQRSPLYGQHVGIIVSVQGGTIDVVSGNSGGDFPGYDVGVWRSGPFDGATSTVYGYHVLGVVSP